MNRLSRLLLGLYPKYLSGPRMRDALQGLPLIEIRDQAAEGDTFAIFFSGDGGWALLTRAVSRALAREGIPVVGFNSLRYFWRRRTADDTGLALRQILHHYLAKWEKKKALLIGYSRGANIIPFAASRLPEELRPSISLIVLLGPDEKETFEVCLKDWAIDIPEALHLPSLRKWMTNRNNLENNLPMDASHSVAVEIAKLSGFRVLCCHGRDEIRPLCAAIRPSAAEMITFEGGHHYGGNYEMVARMIIDRIAKPATRLFNRNNPGHASLSS